MQLWAQFGGTPVKLTDSKLRSLKPGAKPYSIADGGGLFVEVLPTGKRVWRLRYRLHGRQEKVTLGEYPAYTLAAAREWRERCRQQVALGESPMLEKRVKKQEARSGSTFEEFTEIWLAEEVARNVKEPKNIRRALYKDVIPEVGRKRLAEVSVADIQRVVDRIKARGSDQMALHTRDYVKRLYDFAIARQAATQNPAAALQPKWTTTASSVG